MNPLKKYIPLKSKITIYVPATTNVSEATDNTKQVEQAAHLLSDCFGGATSTPAQGYWTTQDGQLVKESTTMVFAYCTTEGAEKHMGDIVDFCVTLKHSMGQEAIALEYNGSMYFI